MKDGQIKMKMLAKVLKTLGGILFWFFAVLFTLFVLASLVINLMPAEKLVLPASVTATITDSIGRWSGGMFTFNLDSQNSGEILIKPFLQSIFLWFTFVSLMLAVVLFEIKRILKTVVEDNPFEKSNSKNLTVIAITLIVGAFLVKFLEGRIAAAVIKALHIGGDIGIGYSVDWTLLGTGILILILAGVFQYGNYLQEEVDSTL